MPTQEGVQLGEGTGVRGRCAKSWQRLLRERGAQHWEGAQQKPGGVCKPAGGYATPGGLQGKVGAGPLQTWGRSDRFEDMQIQAREAEVRADLGGMCKPKLGSLQSGGEDSNYQRKERNCANHLGRLQAPKGVGKSRRPLQRACKPWQGRAGKAGCSRKGWGALLVAWPRPRRVCRQEAGGPGHGAWDICLVGRGPHLPCPAP